MPHSSSLPDSDAITALSDEGGMDENAIYEQIHLAIARQELTPGTRLREDHLRQIFGVSRARIRNVLTRLAYAGVVTLEPNRGASVTQPSPKVAHDNFIARRAVEEAVVRQIAGRLDASGKALIKRNIAAEQKAEAAGDFAEQVWLSGEFHMLLARIAGNEVLERILRDLITREALVIATYERPGRPSCSHDEHQAILDALDEGDADRAVALMNDHLGNVEERLHLDPPRPRVGLEQIFSKTVKRARRS